MTAMPTFRVQTLNWNTVLKEQLGAQVSGVYWWGGLGWCAEWRWAYRKILGSGRHNCNSIVTVSFAIGVNSKCPEPSCRNLCKKKVANLDTFFVEDFSIWQPHTACHSSKCITKLSQEYPSLPAQWPTKRTTTNESLVPKYHFFPLDHSTNNKAFKVAFYLVY